MVLFRSLDVSVEPRIGGVAGGESAVGELEITPVSAAIARHLGIDLSQDGQAARNQRGIAIIVHGAPVSGTLHGATISIIE